MGIFGFLANSDSKRSLKKLNKIADSVEALDSKYAAMDDETLKSQTNVLKERLKTIFCRTRSQRCAKRHGAF